MDRYEFNVGKPKNYSKAIATTPPTHSSVLFCSVQVLTELVGEVHIIHIPVDEAHPDCVFVEDPVVVCGDTALLTILGRPHPLTDSRGSN